MSNMDMGAPSRCPWVNLKNPVYIRYHDEEWSVPCHDDHALYELLILDHDHLLLSAGHRRACGAHGGLLLLPLRYSPAVMMST